jgi:hypothetical protein
MRQSWRVVNTAIFQHCFAKLNINEVRGQRGGRKKCEERGERGNMKREREK